MKQPHSVRSSHGFKQRLFLWQRQIHHRRHEVSHAQRIFRCGHHPVQVRSHFRLRQRKRFLGEFQQSAAQRLHLGTHFLGDVEGPDAGIQITRSVFLHLHHCDAFGAHHQHFHRTIGVHGHAAHYSLYANTVKGFLSRRVLRGIALGEYKNFFSFFSQRSLNSGHGLLASDRQRHGQARKQHCVFKWQHRQCDHFFDFAHGFFSPCYWLRCSVEASGCKCISFTTLKTSSFFAPSNSINTAEPSRSSPPTMRLANGVSTSRWIARFSGRAP